MTPGAVRRALHEAHALASLLLVATGLLLWAPDLRARTLGGYGREILDVHLWAGWALLAAPLLALLLGGRPLLAALRRRLGPPDPPFAWAKVHLAASGLMSFLLAVSGLVLWVDLDFSLLVVDTATEVHLAATWILIASVPVHLALARRRIATRTREILGRVPASEFEPPFFDEDE